MEFNFNQDVTLLEVIDLLGSMAITKIIKFDGFKRVLINEQTGEVRISV